MDQSLIDNYRGAYGHRVGFAARPALIMVDFVQAYFDPACELYAGVDAALAAALRVRAACRARGIPIILTNVVLHPLALDGGRFFEKARPLRHFLAGSAMGAWPEGLAPQAASW